MRRAPDPDARYLEVRLAHLNLVRQGRRILDDITWTVRPSERWVVAGSNGAGKTQLLKTLAGAVWPTAAGSPIRHCRTYRLRGELYRTPYGVADEIAYIGPERQDRYERYGWNPTVEEVIGTGLYRSDIPLNPLTPADHKRVGNLLGRLDIAPLADKPFLTLSYGERRLVLLARALACRPRLLLLDELLSGLDEENRLRARRWLDQTGKSRLPWVLSTHRIDDIPASATHALILEEGKVRYRGVARKAPLAWLLDHETAAGRTAPVRQRKGRGKLLVRMKNASVYLNEQRILEDLSIEVRTGECWVVHGRNGSGKTTLLRTLYGDHAVACGGRIERVGIQPGVPLGEFRRRVGFVAPHLQSEQPLDLTVRTVVQSGRHASIGLNDPPTAADAAAARKSLRFFGLAPLASRALRELSYGQLRRVLFARAWACQPRMLLLDEPFAGVDAPTRAALMALLASVVCTGTALVMSTHHVTEWPACATHEIELAKGRAIYCGPVRLRATSSRVRGGKSR